MKRSGSTGMAGQVHGSDDTDQMVRPDMVRWYNPRLLLRTGARVAIATVVGQLADFREVQAAEQKRDTLEKQADAYANRVLAGARGEAAMMLQEAEGYRAQVVNEAEGQASRFLSVYEEYAKAPEVTRKRLYLETMERVLGAVDKVVIDQNVEGGQGVVPYLPLNELRKGANQ